MVKHTSLCGLGQSAPNPVFYDPALLPDEYLAHIQDRTCPAESADHRPGGGPHMSVYTLRIDGADVAGAARPVDPGRRGRKQHRDPDPVPPGRPQRRRRLPPVRGRGRRAGKLLPACVTAVEEGMEVTAHSERLAGYRHTIVEMLFVERKHICSVCVANNRCELQDLAASQGLHPFRAAGGQPRVGIDASHPLFAIDHNRCVMCTRCACGSATRSRAPTWDVMGRGIDAQSSPTSAPLGRVAHLHQLRQVRPGLPDRGAVREKAARWPRALKPADPSFPYLKRPGEAWSHEQAAAGYRLAGRLLRLPHVVPGHGRSAAGAGQRAELVYSLVDQKDYPGRRRLPGRGCRLQRTTESRPSATHPDPGVIR